MNSTVARRSKRMLSAIRVPRVVVGVARDGGRQVGDAAQAAEVFIVGLEVAEHDDVVFVAPLIADRAEDARQQVEFPRRVLGINLDVDEHEGKGLGLGRPADAEQGRERLVTKRPAGSSTKCTVERSSSTLVRS